MTRITLDTATAAQFQVASGTIEVCDPTGKVVGVFLRSNPHKILSPLTDEERERRDRQPARELSEIWKSLGRT